MATVRITDQSKQYVLKSARSYMGRGLPLLLDDEEAIAREYGYANANDLATQAVWSMLPAGVREEADRFNSPDVKNKLGDLFDSVYRTCSSMSFTLNYLCYPGSTQTRRVNVTATAVGTYLFPAVPTYRHKRECVHGDHHYEVLHKMFLEHEAFYTRRNKVVEVLRDTINRRSTWGAVARDWPIITGLMDSDTRMRLGTTKARGEKDVVTEEETEGMEFVTNELLMAQMLPPVADMQAHERRAIFPLR